MLPHCIQKRVLAAAAVHLSYLFAMLDAEACSEGSSKCSSTQFIPRKQKGFNNSYGLQVIYVHMNLKSFSIFAGGIPNYLVVSFSVVKPKPCWGLYEVIWS